MSWSTQAITEVSPTPLVVFQDEAKYKTLFAEAWLRNPTNPFEAALPIFRGDPGRALFAANNWVRDEFVEAEKKRLLDEFGPAHFLPSKEELARVIWDDGMTQRNGNKLQHLEVYAKVRGFIEKPTEQKVNVNVAIQNKVMVVKDHGSNDEWASKLLEQQQNLIGNEQRRINHLETDTE